LPFLSGPIERRFGHRTLTHSLLFCCVLALFCSPVALLEADVYFCFVAGYVSHPFLDTMNVNGIRLFYPFSSVKCVFPLEVNNPSRYRTQTGSAIDRTLGLLFLLGCLPAFLIANQGFERFVRATQKNIESAVRDYNDFSPANRVFGDFTAHNLLTRESIAGRFEIVGTLNDHTLLFKAGDGELHSLGREYEAEYAAENVVCNKGPAARTVVQTIDMASQPLVTLQQYLDPRWENQLFGSLTTRDPVSLPENARAFQSLSVTGGILNLRFATPEELTLHRLQSVFVERGYLTVRTVIPLTAESLAVAARPVDSVAPGYVTRVLQYRNGELIRQSVHAGDSVRPGDLLARVDDRGASALRLEIEDEKERLLVAQARSRLGALDRQIRSLLLAAALDSVERVRIRRLAAEGLSIPVDPAESSRVAIGNARAMEALLERRQLIRDWCESRLKKQDLDSLRIRQRHEEERLAREVRSNIHGVVVDIRRTERSGRQVLTFILRRAG
jgi:inner membrane protein